MKSFFASKYAILLLALTAAASPLAHATTLGGTAMADDGLYLYISTNNSTLGTEVASISQKVSWSGSASFSNYTLNPGTTYYLHAEVINGSGPGGFVGQFSLSDTERRLQTERRACLQTRRIGRVLIMDRIPRISRYPGSFLPDLFGTSKQVERGPTGPVPLFPAVASLRMPIGSGRLTPPLRPAMQVAIVRTA